MIYSWKKVLKENRFNEDLSRKKYTIYRRLVFSEVQACLNMCFSTNVSRSTLKYLKILRKVLFAKRKEDC